MSGQVRGVIEALQTSDMALLTKIVSNVRLKMSTILAKRCICASVAEFFEWNTMLLVYSYEHL